MLLLLLFISQLLTDSLRIQPCHKIDGIKPNQTESNQVGNTVEEKKAGPGDQTGRKRKIR